MLYVQIIWFVLTNIPNIIKLVRSIIGLIGGVEDTKKANAYTRRLEEGVREARLNRDVSKLEELLCDLRGECEK